MTWTGQSFGVGQVLTAAQMNNLQADITAALNGDAGGPDIKEEAFAAITAGTTYDVFKTHSSQNLSTGSNLTYTVINDSADTGIVSHTCLRAGTYTVSFTIAGDDTYLFYAKFYVDGVAVGTERAQSNSTPTTYTESVTLSVGQKLQLYYKVANASCAGVIRDFKLSSATRLFGG